MAALPEKRWFLLGEVLFLVGVLFYFGVFTGYPFWRFLIALAAGALALRLILNKSAHDDV